MPIASAAFFAARLRSPSRRCSSPPALVTLAVGGVLVLAGS
jgi:hypothetical protein